MVTLQGELKLNPFGGGGRRTPAVTGYQPDLLITPFERGQAIIEFDGGPLYPGERRAVVLEPLSPERWAEVRAGDTLPVCEGYNTIGHFVVMSVHDRPFSLDAAEQRAVRGLLLSRVPYDGNDDDVLEHVLARLLDREREDLAVPEGASDAR